MATSALLPQPYGLLVSFLLGAIVGSYLNVVIHRLPRGLSTWSPGSHCPSCRRSIRWFDNVPVLSWALLRGQCRSCGTGISFRYPLVEASTAALFALCYAKFGPSLASLTAFLFTALLVSLALIDADHLILPDKLTLPGLLIGLALSGTSGITSPLSAGLGALAGALLLLGLIALYFLLRGEIGMGLGDPKMLAMIGAFVGLPRVILTVLIASLAGTVVSVALIVTGRAGTRTRMPFGVYLALGGLVALLFGDRLVRWYLGGAF